MRRLALAALALPAAQALYAEAFKRMLRRNVRLLMDGNVDALAGFYADDAELVFPGDNSWGPVYRGRDEIRAFLERFLRVGIRGEVHEIMVSGPPWSTTLLVHFSDRARGPDGALVYENDAVIRLKVRWGKIVYEQVYEDTEKVAEFDRWLEQHEPAPAAA
jgi:ketosteroid isomerase-like protein